MQKGRVWAPTHIQPRLACLARSCRVQAHADLAPITGSHLLDPSRQARAPPPFKDFQRFDSQSRPMQAQLTQRRAALQRPNRNGCAPQRRALLGSRRAGSCVQVRASEFASGRSTAGLKYVLANGLVDYYEVGQQRAPASPPLFLTAGPANLLLRCARHHAAQRTLAHKGQPSATCNMAVCCAKHNPGSSFSCCTCAGAGRG